MITMHKFYLSIINEKEFRIFVNWSQFLAWRQEHGGTAKGFENITDAISWLSKKGIEVTKEDFPRYLSDFEPYVFEPTIRTHEKPIVGENEIAVYTDGACLCNPNGPGGFSAVMLLPDGREAMVSGYEFSTTNNRMEIMAAIAGLDWLSREVSCQGKQVTLWTDSKYLRNVFAKNWISRWKKNGWKTIKGTDVLNKDLLELLDWLVHITNVTFMWQNGHSGSHFNEKADMIAGKQAKFAAARGGFPMRGVLA